MRLLLLSIQNIFGDRAKTLPLFVVISLAICMLVSFISMNDVLKDKLLADQNTIGPNIIIYPSEGIPGQVYQGLGTSEISESFFSLTATDLKAIKKIPLKNLLKSISPKAMGQVQIQNKKNILTEALLLVGVDFQEEAKLKPWLDINGFEPEKDNEILLGSEAAKRLEASKGDILYLYDNPFLVSGIYRPTGTEDDQYAFMKIKVAQKILSEQITLSDPNFYSYIEINSSGNDFQLEKVIEQIEGRLSGMKVVQFQPYSFRSNRIENQFSRFNNSIISLSIILSVLVILTGIRNYFILKKDEIFYLRSLGYRRFKIFQLYFLTIELIGITAAIWGYILGILLSLTITLIVLRKTETLSWWNPSLFLITFLVTIITIVIGLYINSYALREKDLLYELKRSS